MSPAEIEYRLARSLDDFKARRTRGDRPDPEEYLAELGEVAYEEFREIVELERMLDEVLDPGPEEPLPREFGPYTLVREIGRGAVGIVYEGVHRDLGRHEAVKVLRTGFDEEGTALERFRQEAKVLARVKHDHIVEIYGAGQVDGRPYYAMTLLAGRTLSELARGDEPLSCEALCRGLADVADALHELHEQGVVHRDVKPSNIILTDEGRMVLADFGLARSLQDERITRTGQALGTPLYMSPEQILGRRDDVDGRTDVYGLGATLYEVCAGQPAFQTDDLRALLQSIVNERPESLKKAVPDLPGPCAAIAMKALEKKRRDRYPTAAALGGDLRAFAEGGRVRGRPVSPVRHGLRRLRRYALPIAAVLLATLALGTWYVNRDGTLKVTGTPDVAVWIDDQPSRPAPLSVDLPPGAHDLVLRHAKFGDAVFAIELAAGETYHLDWKPPIPKDADDVETLAILDRESGAEVGGAGLRPFTFGPQLRSAADSDAIAVAVLPGGDVRLDALETYYLEISTELDLETAHLVFERTRDGPPKTLYDELLGEPDRVRILEALPAAVREGVRPGDVVTWGVKVAQGESRMQTFRVVAGDSALDAALARRDEVLEHQAPAIRAAFRAETLLRAGLATEAWFEAGAATHLADPSEPLQLESVKGQGLAWIVMRAALSEVQGSEQSQLAQYVTNVVLSRLPRALRDALTAPATGADGD